MWSMHARLFRKPLVLYVVVYAQMKGPLASDSRKRDAFPFVAVSRLLDDHLCLVVRHRCVVPDDPEDAPENAV